MRRLHRLACNPIVWCLMLNKPWTGVVPTDYARHPFPQKIRFWPMVDQRIIT